MKEFQSEPAKNELVVLASALADLRDSLMEVSVALKDHLANISSPEMLEIELQVARALSQIRTKALRHGPSNT